MEIRLLSPAEARLAAQLAQVVYRGTVEPDNPVAEMNRMFYEYSEPENIFGMVQEGRLLVWGAFDGRNLCGMGAMQPEGHITMLYVLQQFRRRKIGRELLEQMREFALGELGLNRLTVNAQPSWTSGYFKRFGFRSSAGQPARGEFVAMEFALNGVKVYRARPFPATAAAISLFVLLGLSVLTAVCYVAIYL